MALNSVTPPTKYLTFAPWIYLVPQYKPKNVLLLGYAGGTVAGLIRLLYGDVPITAVDIEPSENLYGVNFIQADANEHVKTCEAYDCVIVDTFIENDICEFVYSEEFARNLERISNYIIINTVKTPVMDAYRFPLIGIHHVCGNHIYYFQRKGHAVELTPPI